MKGSAKGQRKGLKITYELDDELVDDYDHIPVAKNHLRQGKLYDEFCILNQEFLKYILSLKLSISEHRILLFLLSYMDMNNKIIIDSEMIEYHLGIDRTNVNKYIKKLEKAKVIYKRNLGYTKGAEILLNFDVISPHMAFKNKGSHDNVSGHKLLMQRDVPYVKQHNLLTGKIDLINSETGEVFGEIDRK
jgi:hypothetical protein